MMNATLMALGVGGLAFVASGLLARAIWRTMRAGDVVVARQIVGLERHYTRLDGLAYMLFILLLGGLGVACAVTEYNSLPLLLLTVVVDTWLLGGQIWLLVRARKQRAARYQRREALFGE